jgi:hypothetical protein
MPDCETTGSARVVRLAQWLLEVVQERPDRPWDEAIGQHAKRRDAERQAREINDG